MKQEDAELIDEWLHYVDELKSESDGSITLAALMLMNAANRVIDLNAEIERLEEQLVKCSRDIQGYKDAFAQCGKEDYA